jgi:hypothetical protein
VDRVSGGVETHEPNLAVEYTEVVRLGYNVFVAYNYSVRYG